MFDQLKSKYLNTSLKRKIVILISLFIAVVPILLVSILAYSYYKLGIESLFNEKITGSINQTVEIAESYFQEHKKNIRADAFEVAKAIEINHLANLFSSEDVLISYLDQQANLRKLSEVILFQKDKLISKNTFSFAYAFEKISSEDLESADRGEIVLIESPYNDKVRAIIKLQGFFQTYLLVGMYVDQSIVSYIKNTKGSKNHFDLIKKDLKETQLRLEIIFVLAFVVMCVLSVAFGIKLAEIITKPLKDLVDATEKLKGGDFSIKLVEREGRDETAILTKAFNQMTEKLADQRNELINFNSIINERRRFIEKVLTEISAGVITLDKSLKVGFFNLSASELVGIKNQSFDIMKLIPSIEGLAKESADNPDSIITTQIKYVKGGVIKNFLTKIGCQLNEKNEIESYIITFDDVTDLVMAQRNAAWSDIARRIAHEIKNPLTPITLATERIKNKFGKQVSEGKEVFDKYLDTILRHVEEIGKMVDEFVRFSRIPNPKFAELDVLKILEESFLIQKISFKGIEFSLRKPSKSKFIKADAGQMQQVFTNIIKNAAESIEILRQKNPDYKGEIKIQAKDNKTSLEILIQDNGTGIDKETLEKIFEPYVTTKSNGTGLGLAIVKKIVEDHQGSIIITPNKSGGVTVKITLPLIMEKNHNG